jgi:hypothetical protein
MRSNRTRSIYCGDDRFRVRYARSGNACRHLSVGAYDHWSTPLSSTDTQRLETYNSSILLRIEQRTMWATSAT